MANRPASHGLHRASGCHGFNGSSHWLRSDADLVELARILWLPPLRFYRSGVAAGVTAAAGFSNPRTAIQSAARAGQVVCGVVPGRMP